MFGFFDREKRRKKRVLEDFAKMVRAHPFGAGGLKLVKQRFIVQRASVLRDAGNIEEAEKTVLLLLSDDFELWRDKRDPRDLQFIADTLRGGRMPQKCCEVLNEVLECTASGKYSIDLTWLYIDYGLALHQQGKGSDECLMWFDRALGTTPRGEASIVAGSTIRARAAFCAFVTCVANHREKDASRYVTILKALEPSRDWDDLETIKAYKKTFLGFLAPSDREAPSAATRRATLVFAPKSDAENRPSDRNASGETVFHVFVQLPRNNPNPSLSSVLVTAETWVKIEADGSRQYGSRIYECADPFTVNETQGVIYWKQCLDRSAVSAEQMIGWLQSLEEAGSSKYLHPQDGKREVVDEMGLLAGLTAASLHYGISNMDQLEYPESLKKWLRAGIARGDGFRRSVDIQKARLLEKALSGHTIDPIFVAHLAKSVGGK